MKREEIIKKGAKLKGPFIFSYIGMQYDSYEKYVNAYFDFYKKHRKSVPIIFELLTTQLQVDKELRRYQLYPREVYMAQHKFKELERAMQKRKLRKLIIPLEREEKKWKKQKEEFVKRECREILQSISENKLQISKLEMAINFQKKALKNYESEALKKFNKEHPFELRHKLKYLKSKMYKIL